MLPKYKVLAVIVGLAVLVGVVSFSNLPGALTEIRAQEQEKLAPSVKLDLGGSKVNGFLFTADGKFVFVSVSVGRESSVFLVAASTADTTKFYGKKVRGCPIAGEICLVQIRGNVNPQDLAYNEAKKVLFVPGYDDDTLYVSQVVFDKDGNPTAAKAAKKVAVGAGPRAVAVNAEGTRAFTVNERDHTVSVVDILYKDGAPDKGEVIATITLNPEDGNLTIEQDKSETISILPTATYVTITNSGPGKVEVSLGGGQPIVVNPNPEEPLTLDISGVRVMTMTAREDKADVAWSFGPKYPSPADIILKGDKAYTVNSDTWKVCEIKNVNAASEKVKKGEEKIELGDCVDTGAYPRAMAVLKDKAYVVNSAGDSVSPLSLDPLKPVLKDDQPVEIPVGDAPRGIATDGQCWTVVTNTNVDNVEGVGVSLTFIHESLDQVLTVLIAAMVEGDPITPTQVQVLATADAKFAWVLNISARGELLVYPVPDQVKTCP